MLARPSPVVVLMTLRKRPIDWRAPIVTANTPPAASRTRPKATGARERAAAGVVDSGIGALRLGVGQGGETVVEKRVQRGDAFGAEALVEGDLGALPLALRLGALGAAERRGADQTRAAVGTGADLGPALRDEELQVAGQRRCVHRHRRGEITRPDRPEALDVGEQRILRRL